MIKVGVVLEKHRISCFLDFQTCPSRQRSQFRIFTRYKTWLPLSQCSKLSVHDAFGTSNMHKVLYFCSSWFLVRTCSCSVASCCCCSGGLQSIPGMLVICSRASWIFALSLASSWWTSWLSLSMLGDNEVDNMSIIFRVLWESIDTRNRVLATVSFG